MADELRTTQAHHFFLVAGAAAVAVILGVPLLNWALSLVGIKLNVTA